MTKLKIIAELDRLCADAENKAKCFIGDSKKLWRAKFECYNEIRLLAYQLPNDITRQRVQKKQKGN